MKKIYKDEYIKPSLKMVTVQDKAVAVKEKGITFLEKSHHKGEEDLKSEVKKAKSELDTCKQ